MARVGHGDGGGVVTARAVPLLLAGSLLFATPAWAQSGPAKLPNGKQEACLQAPQGLAAAVPWAQQQLAPQRVWPLTRGEGVVVAVVDTGVDGSVPQLAGGKVQRGVDLTSPGNGPADSDCFGHGTFLAGIIAASASPDTGFAGIAPGVTILPIRCATSAAQGEAGSLTPAGMARGIRQAVDSGADVINISASTTIQDGDLAAAVRYAGERDVVVVASAANGAKDGDPVTYPASYPGVIAVGAVDVNGQRADFSQTGPYLSLTAPGVDVISVGPRGPGHWQGSGTSYAAPFVAAAAALVRSYRPALTAAQVKHRLETTANHPPVTMPNPAVGWGTVNLMAAVTTELAEENPPAAAAPIAPPAARAPITPEPDELGPLLAVLGILGAAIFAFALVITTRLVTAARRRRWTRPRIAHPTD